MLAEKTGVELGERGEKRSASDSEKEESAKKVKMATTEELLASLLKDVKDIKKNQVKREDEVSKDEVKVIVREVVGNETVEINRRLLRLEKKEEDRDKREGRKGKGGGKRGLGTEGKKKKTKKTQNATSLEFIEARR